jgi:hypothetical protein
MKVEVKEFKLQREKTKKMMRYQNLIYKIMQKKFNICSLNMLFMIVAT